MFKFKSKRSPAVRAASTCAFRTWHVLDVVRASLTLGTLLKLLRNRSDAVKALADLTKQQKNPVVLDRSGPRLSEKISTKHIAVALDLKDVLVLTGRLSLSAKLSVAHTTRHTEIAPCSYKYNINSLLAFKDSRKV